MNRRLIEAYLAGQMARDEQPSARPPRSRRGCLTGCLPWWLLPLCCTLALVGEAAYRVLAGYFR